MNKDIHFIFLGECKVTLWEISLTYTPLVVRGAVVSGKLLCGHLCICECAAISFASVVYKAIRKVLHNWSTCLYV